MGPKTRQLKLSEKQLRERRAVVINLVSRIDALREELRICTDAGHRREIAAQLKDLRRKQGRLSLAPDKKIFRLPSTYVERNKADQKARARLSGRDKIKAHFLQGGAPGTGK